MLRRNTSHDNVPTADIHSRVEIQKSMSFNWNLMVIDLSIWFSCTIVYHRDRSLLRLLQLFRAVCDAVDSCVHGLLRYWRLGPRGYLGRLTLLGPLLLSKSSMRALNIFHSTSVILVWGFWWEGRKSSSEGWFQSSWRCQGRWGPGNQVDIKLRYLWYPSFTIYYNEGCARLNRKP